MSVMYWYAAKKFTGMADLKESSCPLCAAGHVPTLKMMVPVIILKKKYKPIINKYRANRRALWNTI